MFRTAVVQATNFFVLTIATATVLGFIFVTAAICSSCITTTSPDGTVVHQPDIATVQIALMAAQYAWEQYQEEYPGSTESEEANNLQARIDALGQLLDQLVALSKEAQELPSNEE